MTTLKTMTAAMLLGSMSFAAQAGDSFIGRTQPAISQRQFTPELLWAMGRIGHHEASPDGRTVVYNVSYYSVADNKSHTVIYTVDTATGQEQLLTQVPASELAPKFIDGGRRIAFLSPDANGVMQLFTMNTDGSNRRQASHLDRSIDDFLCSPDGTRLIAIHQVKSGQRATDLHPDLPHTTGRIIEGAMYRHWDEWVEEVPQPFIYAFDGNEVGGTPVALLGQEPYECPMKPFGGIEQLAWSTDSRYVAYTCRKKTGLDYATSTDSDIYLFDTTTGSTRNLCKPQGYKAPATDCTRSLQHQAVNAPIKEGKDYNLGYDTDPQFSPDGQYLAWKSMERDGYESDRIRLCVYHLATGEKTYTTELFRSSVDAFCWAADSRTLFFMGCWHATHHLFATNLKGQVHRITQGQYDYTSVALCGNRLLCGRQSMREPLELYLVDPTRSVQGKKVDIYKERAPKASTTQGTTTYDFEANLLDNAAVGGNTARLTHENDYFVEGIDWGTVEHRIATTTDHKELFSWIILPPHFDPNKKYPALLYCQGGPQSPVSQFWSARWNFMMMASQGYVVVAPNRRGLGGFGMEWLEEISTNYSGQCMDDYKTAIDDAVSHCPYIDADRLGCVGASFGGYSVYWLAGNHEKRFKCFIAHDGIFNTEQQYLETEEMWFANWDLGGAPWHNDPAIRRNYDNSPHKFVDRWDTPILCIQGEKDYRIVTSQAMAAYNAALYRGIPAQFLVFPDENHWVLRPQNGILWQRTFFGWLDRWLK